MKLREVIDLNRLLEVSCGDCHARTPLDPTFFAKRRGFDATLGELRQQLVCPGCGSAEIEIAAVWPSRVREPVSEWTVAKANADVRLPQARIK